MVREIISASCLKRRDLVGTVSGTNFSDENILTTQIYKDMKLYAYRECNDS